ncbi:MAG: TonB-dependent receptor plug domain-containing protein, partial [Pseudomonadota bacterium]
MTTRRFLLCSTLPLCLMSVAQAQSITEPDFLLDPIIVGSGLGKVASETPQSVSVVTAEEIDRAQASTVGELVETLPGVSVFGSEQVLGQQINIRGIGTGQDGDQNSTITRIDGVEKFYQQYRMGALFTEPELFNRVEILRGPASSTLTGAGAVGGV